MIKIQGRDIEYELTHEEGEPILNGSSQNWDLVKESEGSYHVIADNKSYGLEVVEANYETKEFKIRVDNTLYSLSAKDQFDELLEKLGMDNLSAGQAEDLKAPMPGLVLDVKVKPGDEVSTSDVVLVLEAMKMENNIKAPANGVVKSIEIEKGQAVEKNQVMVTFE